VAPNSAERETILVADDSMTMLAMVSARLERAGYDVITVTRGDDALSRAQELRPRLVVLDVEMPGLDGLEVTRRLRADETMAGLLIVLLTASSGQAEIDAGVAAGADAYVTKPFSPQELEARVEQLLGHY